MLSWDIPWTVYSAAQSSSKTMLIENRLYIYSFCTPFSSVPWPNTRQYTGRHNNNNNITILCAMYSSIDVWRLLRGPDDDAYILNVGTKHRSTSRVISYCSYIAFRSRRWNILYFYDFPRGTGMKFALRSAASIINAYRRGKEGETSTKSAVTRWNAVN